MAHPCLEPGELVQLRDRLSRLGLGIANGPKPTLGSERRFRGARSAQEGAPGARSQIRKKMLGGKRNGRFCSVVNLAIGSYVR